MNENDKPLDFSLLDPSRHHSRWQARIDGIIAETLRRRRQKLGLTVLLARYARPALAIAAALALMSWIGASQYRNKALSADASSSMSPILLWATNDEVPATSEVFRSLGVEDVE